MKAVATCLISFIDRDIGPQAVYGLVFLYLKNKIVNDFAGVWDIVKVVM